LLLLEHKVAALLTESEANLVIRELRKLRHRPFRDLLGMYPDYMVKLAERSGKSIYPFAISGGYASVDPDVLSEFSRSLVHVFRNMIDHGIETPEERASFGKDKSGAIGCEIVQTGDGFELALHNDGRAIRIADIRKMAVDLSLCTEQAFDAMSEQEQLQIIFADAFTTRQAVTELSGRGVGLSAVRRAVDKLGGSIRAESAEFAGTTFRFTIPYAL